MSLIQNFYSAIDCSNPVELAKFYSKITGFKVELGQESDEKNIYWVELKNDQNQTQLAFQKIPNYQKPTWPEGDIPQQIHLDFLVDNIEEVEAKVLQLGAKKAVFQPGIAKNLGEPEFRVYLDPEGHPFCLIYNPN